MAVLQAVGGKLNVTLLNKLLFYWDLHALLETGESVTGSAYVALHQGPVLAKFKERLVDRLQKAGLAEEKQEGCSKPLRVVRNIEVQLPTRLIKLLDDVLALARRQDWTSSKASDYSHQNPGWMLAYEQGLKAKKSPLPINMSLAIQQLGADDPWLDAPLTSQEQGQLDSDAKNPTFSEP